MHKWSAYLKEDVVPSSPERDYMKEKWPDAAEHDAFYLFVEVHPDAVDPIDVEELSVEDINALINTHVDGRAIHMSKGKAKELYKYLNPEV